MAGLLDAIFPSSDGGGLLDFLKRNAQNQQMPSGLPSDTAQYGSQGMAAMSPQQPPMPQGMAGVSQAPAPMPVYGKNDPIPADTAQWPVGPVGSPYHSKMPVYGKNDPIPADTAQWPVGPVGSPFQANATAPVPQNPPPVIPASMPQQQAPQMPNLTQALGMPGNFLQRLGTAITNIPRGGADDPAIVAQRQQAAIAQANFQALVDKGVPRNVAFAAAQPGNAEMFKNVWDQANAGAHTRVADKDGNIYDVGPDGKSTVLVQAKDDKFQHVQTGEFGGQKTYGTFNTKTGELKSDAGGDSAGGAPFGALLAKGVQYDPNKSGPDYMAQFSPEVQAAAKAYINGDVIPTGNARKDSITTFAKTVAQKYGQDMGIPVNDSTYAGKRTMQTQLSSSSNSSMGGILSNGESSFSHLAEFTNSAADLGNVSHNFTGGGAIAHAQNYIGNSMGGSDRLGKIGATVDNLGKYGSESTKFYAGTGGGVEERTAARKDVDPNKVSGEEMASFAEKEKNLMLDRLNTKFQEIRNTFGEEEGNRIIAKHMPQIQKNIATIDANVAKMRGQAPDGAPTPTKPATVTQNGHTYTLQADGSYK